MTKTYRRSFAALLVAALALSIVAALSPAQATGGAIIDNGTIQLGVHDEGHLNVFGGEPSSGEGTSYVGLRYMPTGAESTAPGCLCEGWGAADETSGVTGFANEDSDGGANNITPVSFAFTASTAVSVVRIEDTLEVTHDYHPSATANLYEVAVTIRNLSGSDIVPRYRRVMDWDVEPTAFEEFVTAQIGDADDLIYNNNDGFATANPLGSAESGFVDPVVTGNFVDNGPNDHGALFDFRFDPLAPGASKTFKTFYGAAGTESEANTALAAVGAEVYSFGQASTEDGPTLGTPNTFIFAFGGVGGTPLGCGEDGLDALHGGPGDGLVSGTVHESVEPLVASLDEDSGERVHRVNCIFVRRAENVVDDALGTSGNARTSPGINPRNLIR
ncbi:MAG TPA: hypothetical protein VGB64_01370 [Actinomycetota bacterium]